MSSIRLMRVSDRDDIMELIDAVNQQDFLQYSLTDEWFEYVLKEAGEHLFVAEKEIAFEMENLQVIHQLKVVGFATCMIDWVSNEACQMNVIVHPQHRRQGIGSALFQKLLEHSQEYQLQKAEALVKQRLQASTRFAERRNFLPVIYSWTMEIVLDKNKHSTIQYPEKLNTDYQLRQAQADDLHIYMYMMEECFQHQVDSKHFQQMFTDPSVALYFFTEQSTGTVVGMITIQYRRNLAMVYLYDIAILPVFQQQGFGSRMIIAALEVAKQSRMEKAGLVVDGVNKNALSLYGKLGFKEVDEDILMEKSLSE